MQVRCRNRSCGKTHAVIPGFSVPGCSTGTAELNQFIIDRAAGRTIDEAGQIFCNAGMSPDYPVTIHRMLKKYSKRISVFIGALQDWPELNSTHYAGFLCCLADKLEENRNAPAAVININSCNFNCNPFLFSRKNILAFPENNSDADNSYNMPFHKPP